jgi:hypothetical protein
MYNATMTVHVFPILAHPQMLQFFVYDGPFSAFPAELRRWDRIADELCSSGRVLSCLTRVSTPSRGTRPLEHTEPPQLAGVVFSADAGSGPDVIQAVIRYADTHGFAIRHESLGDVYLYSDRFRIGTATVSTEQGDSIHLFVRPGALIPTESEVRSFVAGLHEAVAGLAGVEMTVTQE